VAGAFYPADPRALSATVDGLLDSVDVPDDDRLAAAYVVPHAGYRYSGPIAAHVYARLRKHAAKIRRIVLIGPAHRVPLSGAAVPVDGRWRTPLGVVELGSGSALVSRGLATATDVPHAPEHSLEVQLPFLQRVFPDGCPEVLPVCIGQTPTDVTKAAIDATDDALVLCSTDLSHYLTEAQAREQDAHTAQAIVDLAPERIGPRDACGSYALRGLLGWARDQRLTATVLDLRTSADTAGSPDRVVGYPAVAFHRHSAWSQQPRSHPGMRAAPNPA
jgi:AmmeMemoRadiSam system protein B